MVFQKQVSLAHSFFFFNGNGSLDQRFLLTWAPTTDHMMHDHGVRGE